MKMQGPPDTRPPHPVNQPGSGAGGRQKEGASDDLFTCVFLEEQNGLFWFWLPGRKAGRARQATSPSPPPQGDATSSHSGSGPGVQECVHTLPCQVLGRALAAVITQGPEQATAASVQGVGWDGACAVSDQCSLKAEVVPLAAGHGLESLCSAWVFLHEADGLLEEGAWDRNSQKTAESSRPHHGK